MCKVCIVLRWYACSRHPCSCPLQPTSVFAEAYSSGINKAKYWEPIYEDSLNLIAKLPAIAAHIYRCACLVRYLLALPIRGLHLAQQTSSGVQHPVVTDRCWHYDGCEARLEEVRAGSCA